jgi:hypothetical protein
MANYKVDWDESVVQALIANPELIKNKEWRLNHLYWIITKNPNERGETRIPFKMNRAQKHFFDNYLNVPVPYHRHIILKSRQLGFCLDPKTKVLTADLRWIPIGELKEGQEIISVDEFTKGHRGQGRKMRTGIVEAVVKVKRKAYKICFDDGRSVICTGQHPWLAMTNNSDPRWKAIEKRPGLCKGKLEVGNYIRYITKPWGEPNFEDGWFAGILDGEGSISKSNSSAGINVSQLPGKVFDRMLDYVNKNGYHYRIENDKTERKTKYGKKPVSKICIGRMDEIFHLIGKLRPSRFINNRFWENRELPGKKSGIGWSKIVSIENLPDQEMIDLQTSTGTYIAEGFVSHNTTLIQIWILDGILFGANKEAIVIAHKMEDAKEFFDRKIDYAIRNMASEVKGTYFKIMHTSARKLQITQDYGPDAGSTSSIQVSTSGRSGTYHYVHISEYAKMCVLFPTRAQEVETGTFPAVPLSGFIFIESTAEGQAGRFYELFNENWLSRDKITPQKSQAQFLPHFYNWQYDDMEMEKIHTIIPVSEMDECEIDWAEYQKDYNLTDKEMTYYYTRWLQFGGKNSPDAIKRLHQEYPTTPTEAFLSTGQSFFSMAHAAQLLQTAIKGKRGELFADEKGKESFMMMSNGNLEIFEEPKLGHKYIIGGDTAEGLVHGDYQVLYVLDHMTEECVALYRSHVPPDELASIAYHLGKYYNWALMAIESNKDGLWVNDSLEKAGYINLYYRKAFDDITQKVTKLFGWKTTSSTRPFALTAIRAVFTRKNSGFPAQILNEMFTFVRNQRGKPEALLGKNDDIISAASIAYAVMQELGKYVADKQPGEGESILRVMFGENRPPI